MHSSPTLVIAAIVVSAAIAGGESTARAQRGTPPAAAAPDITKLGPQPGEALPDFTLRDHNDQPRNLQSLMGEEGLVLVFSRSADW